MSSFPHLVLLKSNQFNSAFYFPLSSVPWPENFYIAIGNPYSGVRLFFFVFVLFIFFLCCKDKSRARESQHSTYKIYSSKSNGFGAQLNAFLCWPILVASFKKVKA